MTLAVYLLSCPNVPCTVPDMVRTLLTSIIGQHHFGYCDTMYTHRITSPSSQMQWKHGKEKRSTRNRPQKLASRPVKSVISNVNEKSSQEEIGKRISAEIDRLFPEADVHEMFTYSLPRSMASPLLQRLYQLEISTNPKQDNRRDLEAEESLRRLFLGIPDHNSCGEENSRCKWGSMVIQDPNSEESSLCGYRGWCLICSDRDIEYDIQEIALWPLRDGY